MTKLVISVTPHLWLQVPTEVRNKLAKEFGLKRSESPSVENGFHGSRIVSDGHTAEDLLGITSDKLQTYLGFKTQDDNRDILALFQLAVEKAEGKAPVADTQEPKGKAKGKKE